MGVPTIHERIQVTRDSRVDHIIAVGERRFPGKRPGRILTALAAERVADLEAEADPFAGFPTLLSPGGALTSEMVADALDE